MKLYIDGQNIKLERAFPFYQADPYPGGHNFQLCILFKDKASLQKILLRYNLSEPLKINWSTFFLYITANWPIKKDVNECEYFINSVIEIKIDDLNLILSGICSPVIH